MRGSTYAWILVLIPFAYLTAVIIVPWIYAIYLSFTDLSYTASEITGKFIWDKNYVDMFADIKLYSSLFRTVMIMIPAILIQMFLGLLIAWGLYSLGTGKKVRVLNTLFILPTVMASSVVALTWYFILHGQWGVLTYILRAIGILSERTSIWSDPQYVNIGYIIVDTWQWLPFTTLLFWAGMNGISRDVIDSAAIDGAKGFFLFRKVLFPAILPLFGIVLLLRGMDLFKIIDSIYIITYGGPGDTSETIHFYGYRQSFRLWNIGYGSTISMLIFFIIEVASALYVKFFLVGYAYKR